MSLAKTLLNKLADKAKTADFWRGLIYAATGTGIALDPQAIDTVVSAAFIISGVLHTIWHRPKVTVENAK